MQLLTNYFRRACLAGSLFALCAAAHGQSFFQNQYIFPGYSAETHAVAHLLGGQIAVGGSLYFDLDGSQSAFLMLLDAKGDLLWSKQFDQPQEQDLIRDIERAPDNGMMVVFGQNVAGGSVSAVSRIDLSGNVQWTKMAPDMGLDFLKIVPVFNGYLLCGRNAQSGAGYVAQLGPDGQHLWARTISANFNEPVTLSDAWEDAQGFLYVAGDIAAKEGFFLRLFPNGNVDWAQRIRRVNTFLHFTRIIPQPGDLLLLGGNISGGASFDRAFLMQSDRSGMVKWSRSYGSSQEAIELTDLIPQGSNIMALSGLGGASNLGAGVGGINASGDLLWLKNFDPFGQSGDAPHVAAAASNTLATAATLQSGSGKNVYVTRTNAAGDAPPCCMKSHNLDEVLQAPVTVEFFSPDTEPDQGLLFTNRALTARTSDQSNLCAPVTPAFTLSDYFIWPGDCIEATVTNPAPDVTYTWTVPGGVIDPAKPGRYCLPGFSKDTFVVLTANGCQYQQVRDTLFLDGGPEQYPNAFTPNGDGTNDVFKPILHCPAATYRFAVYNRWGELMFETTSTGAGWDGTFNGLEAPADVYAWVVNIGGTGSDFQKKGSVALLR